MKVHSMQDSSCIHRFCVTRFKLMFACLRMHTCTLPLVVNEFISQGMSEFLLENPYKCNYVFFQDPVLVKHAIPLSYSRGKKTVNDVQTCRRNAGEKIHRASNCHIPYDSVCLSTYNLSTWFHIIFMSDQMFLSETRTLLVSHLYLFLL